MYWWLWDLLQHRHRDNGRYAHGHSAEMPLRLQCAFHAPGESEISVMVRW